MAYLMNWFEALTLAEQIFACIAVVFSVLLVVQFVLLLIGAASHAGGDLDGHDMGAHGHDFGDGNDVDVGHDFGDGHGDFSHDFGHDVGHDFGHDFGHGDVAIHGDVAHDFSTDTDIGDIHTDVGHDFGTDVDHDFGTHSDMAHDAVTMDSDGSYDYNHDMQAGHSVIGHTAHDFGQVQGSVVVDVHSGDIYLAEAAPHVPMYTGPDAGIPDQHLPDGRIYVDRADKTHGSGFRLFSMQGIIAFFCLFGWTGLIFTKLCGLNVILAALIAFVCGFIGMLLMSLAMWGMLKIQSDGTVNIRYALGLSGEVYIPIPGKRELPGKVMVKVQDQLREFDAVTDDEEKIPTGSQVTVIGITKGTTLIVTKHT